MKYLDGEELTIEEIKAGHPQGYHRQRRSFRLSAATSYKNKGVQKLLDAIVDYMPAPDRRCGHQGRQPRDRARRRIVTPPTTEPFAALAFKIAD